MPPAVRISPLGFAKVLFLGLRLRLVGHPLCSRFGLVANGLAMFSSLTVPVICFEIWVSARAGAAARMAAAMICAYFITSSFRFEVHTRSHNRSGLAGVWS